MDTTNTEQSNSKKRRRFTAQERTQHLKHWENSGLSAVEYANNHGLEARHLYAWKRQSKRAGMKQGKESGTFIPVRLKGTPSRSEGLAITLRHNGLELIVSGASEIDTLVSISRQLRKEVLDV